MNAEDTELVDRLKKAGYRPAFHDADDHIFELECRIQERWFLCVDHHRETGEVSVVLDKHPDEHGHAYVTWHGDSMRQFLDEVLPTYDPALHDRD